MKFDIKHVSYDPQSMSHDGGKILKSLQNESLPLIDVIVREAIQNSLDASLNPSKNTEVNFIINKFNSEKIAPYFSEINTKLLKNHPGEQNFIAIQDKGTKGLIGDYKLERGSSLDDSNFHKLVFSIGKNQEEDGAGGSWGYGKTSFFRLGIGLIVYYTRIKTNDAYEERLIASMIEDPRNKERYLANNPRGIAWWGELSSDEGDPVYPITDSNQIREFLEQFNLSPYQEDETGTMILMPFIPAKEITAIDKEVEVFPWEKTYEREIEVSIQRWYFPRLLNETYSKHNKNSTLIAKVNDKVIGLHLEVEPVFGIYQELYNAGLTGVTKNQDITIKPISFQATAKRGDLIGRVAFREVSRKELGMLPPQSKSSALAYLGEKSKAVNERFKSSVMAFSRRPGMIIEYSIDGRWIPSNVTIKDDYILLASFVPQSFVELSNEFSNKGYETLEQYLRDIETSDHATWDDKVGITIVKRLKSYSSKAILDEYRENEENIEGFQTSALARRMGQKFLPPKKFGKASTRSESPRRSSNRKGSFRKSSLSVERTKFIDNDTIQVYMSLKLRKQSNNDIYIYIQSQERNMDYSTWYKTFGDKVDFAFDIDKIERLEKTKYQTNVLDELNSEQLNFEKKDNGTVNIKNFSEENLLVDIRLTCKIKRNDLLPNIGIKAIKDGLDNE